MSRDSNYQFDHSTKVQNLLHVELELEWAWVCENAGAPTCEALEVACEPCEALETACDALETSPSSKEQDGEAVQEPPGRSISRVQQRSDKEKPGKRLHSRRKTDLQCPSEDWGLARFFILLFIILTAVITSAAIIIFVARWIVIPDARFHPFLRVTLPFTLGCGVESLQAPSYH
ncbi:hypothetical protein B0H13DRAFT_2334554 [Mycena leptocephala]|nr:hypothetical protein B0H13DRAFT_2334554 [Mycena leptocephala]